MTGYVAQTTTSLCQKLQRTQTIRWAGSCRSQQYNSLVAYRTGPTV